MAEDPTPAEGSGEDFESVAPDSPKCFVGAQAKERLAELGIDPEWIDQALRAALAEARSCTDLDAPGAAGSILWTRTNRFYREHAVHAGWSYSNGGQILTTIHPSGEFAITAISGSGKVGLPEGKPRTKNPKGPFMARMVAKNWMEFLPSEFVEFPSEVESRDDIPTWILLYEVKKNVLRAELSLPVEMHGKAVDTWLERIMLNEIPYDGPSVEIANLDLPDDSDGPSVAVEFVGRSTA